MAKVDDHQIPGWDEPPTPLRARRKPGDRPAFRGLGIRTLMVALIWFAILFWAIRQVATTDEVVQRVLLAALIGLGVSVFGIWAALKLKRLSVLGWFIFIAGYAILGGSTAGFFAIPTLPILIGAIIYLNLRRLSNNQDALLWVLTVAAERGMPLAPGVQAFSGQVSGIFEVWTESLADLLRRGVALPEAIDSLPKLVPRGSSTLIRTGWEAGALARGLREAVDTRTRRDPAIRAVGGRIAYLGWVVTVGLGVVGFVMYFIIPKFEAIFKDFGVELPEVTILVIRASHFLVDYAWAWTLITVATVAYALVGVFGANGFSVPLVDRLFPRRHAVLIFRALAVSVEAGRPVPTALASLGQWYPTAWVGRRLGKAGDAAAHGIDWVEAMQATGLITAGDAGVLASAQRAGNLAWALRELADTEERRRGYRLQAWTQVLFLLSMLVLGGLVFVIAVAYFAPLTTLITRLAR